MVRMKGHKKTNMYPDEFKIKAVQIADHPNILANDVAEDLRIHPILLISLAEGISGRQILRG